MRIEFKVHYSAFPVNGDIMYSYNLLDDAGRSIAHKSTPEFVGLIGCLLQTLDEYSEKPIEVTVNEPLKSDFRLRFQGNILTRIVDLHNRANYSDLEKAMPEIVEDYDSEVF